MTEFHVDNNKQFANVMNLQKKFGGKLSSLFIQVPAAWKRKWKDDGWIKHDYGYDYTAIDGQQLTEVHALQFFQNIGLTLSNQCKVIILLLQVVFVCLSSCLAKMRSYSNNSS